MATGNAGRTDIILILGLAGWAVALGLFIALLVRPKPEIQYKDRVVVQEVKAKPCPPCPPATVVEVKTRRKGKTNVIVQTIRDTMAPILEMVPVPCAETPVADLPADEFAPVDNWVNPQAQEFNFEKASKSRQRHLGFSFGPVLGLEGILFQDTQFSVEYVSQNWGGRISYQPFNQAVIPQIIYVKRFN